VTLLPCDHRAVSDRALLVFGARNLGGAILDHFLADGWSAAAVARSDDTLGRVRDRGATAIGADATKPDEVAAALARARAELGGLDLLVNTAAAPWKPGMGGSTLDITDDQMREHFEVKALGYLRMARAAAPHMIAGGWGRIVNVSGLGARHAGSAVQTVRNVAVAAITKNLADDLGPHGINVTVVHPGMTRTDAVARLVAERAEADGATVEETEIRMSHNSIRRLVDATEVADVITFLASPRSIAITGDAIAVGGGDPGVVAY
jgi:NAD(P)-dependent dehydrogenase (short-subunit alcohol dehydrogenase family)